MLGPLSIAIWNDIADDYDAEFNEWHTREHMSERIGIPGFLRGRRYEAISASVRYFTLYELAGEDVLTGPDYKARLNSPTQWSQQSTAVFSNNYRGVCDVVVSRAVQAGGNAIISRFDLGDEDLDVQALEVFARDALRWSAVCGVHVLRCNKGLSGTKTALQANRKILLPDTAILIEVVLADAVDEVKRRWSQAAQDLFCGKASIVDTYRLQCEILSPAPQHILADIHPKAWK